MPRNSQGTALINHFKVKLKSGRILGPLDVDRIRLLVIKKKITGSEMVREYPDGEWRSIFEVPLLVELLVSHVSSEEKVKRKVPKAPVLNPPPPSPSEKQEPLLAPAPEEWVAPALPALSRKAPQIKPIQFSTKNQASEPPQKLNIESQDQSPKQEQRASTEVGTLVIGESKPGEDRTETFEANLNPGESTLPFESHEIPEARGQENADLLPLDLYPSSSPLNVSSHGLSEYRPPSDPYVIPENPVTPGESVASEKTVLLPVESRPSKLAEPKNFLKIFLIAGALGYFGYDTFLNEPSKPEFFKIEIIKPLLPSYVKGNSEPKKKCGSVQFCNEVLSG